ncbi:MAG: hypothetical protein H7X97_12160 [Opitutaceae bacterium]|nr:hypothetical protein [Verrucomicrobiales bacterium]
MKFKILILPLLIVIIAGCASGTSPSRVAGLPDNYQLLYHQDFQKPSGINDFVFTDLAAWRQSQEGTNTTLELFGKSKYQPKHRSPFNIALLADRTFGDFTLDVKLQSTIKTYPHQDMCLFFGFEATNRFYYTHIAARPDPIKAESHAHDIFIVNDAPRFAIAETISPGVVWGEGAWHQIRIERRLADGTIKIYYDDLTKPIMVGHDKTFGAGYIGFGSFDDTGKFDDIRIYGPAAGVKKTPFFQRR